MNVYETLLVERHEDGFATIVFNRPDKRNALTLDTLEGLVETHDLAIEPLDRILMVGGINCPAADACVGRLLGAEEPVVNQLLLLGLDGLEALLDQVQADAAAHADEGPVRRARA